MGPHFLTAVESSSSHGGFLFYFCLFQFFPALCNEHFPHLTRAIFQETSSELESSGIFWYCKIPNHHGYFWNTHFWQSRSNFAMDQKLVKYFYKNINIFDGDFSIINYHAKHAFLWLKIRLHSKFLVLEIVYKNFDTKLCGKFLDKFFS